MASAANAQKTELPEPHFYVGLQASYMHYPGVGNKFADFPTYGAIYPLAATIGYRVSRNTTLEVGFTGRFPRKDIVEYNTCTTEYARHLYAVPILVRGAFVRATPTNPWRVEITEGLVVLHGHQQGLYYQQQAGKQLLSSNSRDDNDVQLALGIGATYRLNQHWRLTGDLQAQYSFISLLASKLFGPDNGNGFGGGVTVGLRYGL